MSNITEATKEDWEDFWNESESSEKETKETFEEVWKKMDEIEPLTPPTK